MRSVTALGNGGCPSTTQSSYGASAFVANVFIASNPSYQAPADVMMVGDQLAACMPCQIGPYPKATITRSRSGLALLSWAIAVEGSTDPGLIDAVLTTWTLGALVLSGLRMEFAKSTSC